MSSDQGEDDPTSRCFGTHPNSLKHFKLLLFKANLIHCSLVKWRSIFYLMPSKLLRWRSSRINGLFLHLTAHEGRKYCELLYVEENCMCYFIEFSIQGLSPDIVPSTFAEDLVISDFPEPHEYPVATATQKAVEVYEKLVVSTSYDLSTYTEYLAARRPRECSRPCHRRQVIPARTGSISEQPLQLIRWS